MKHQDSTLPFYLENGFASQAYGFEHIAKMHENQWKGVPNSFREMENRLRESISLPLHPGAPHVGAEGIARGLDHLPKCNPWCTSR